MAEVLIFSVFSYSLLGLINEALRNPVYYLQNITVFQAAVNDKIPIAWHEILYASLIGVLLAILAAYSEKFHLFNRIGQLIGASAKYGYGDTWNNFNTIFGGNWVYVRDHKNDLTYYGSIFVYSDVRNAKEREVIMKDVDVYSNVSGELLYKCDVVYLSRSYDDLTVEVPSSKNEATNINPKNNQGKHLHKESN